MWEWKNVYTVIKKGHDFMEIVTYQPHLRLSFTDMCVLLMKHWGFCCTEKAAGGSIETRSTNKAERWVKI